MVDAWCRAESLWESAADARELLRAGQTDNMVRSLSLKSCGTESCCFRSGDWPAGEKNTEADTEVCVLTQLKVDSPWVRDRRAASSAGYAGATRWDVQPRVVGLQLRGEPPAVVGAQRAQVGARAAAEAHGLGLQVEDDP